MYGVGVGVLLVLFSACGSAPELPGHRDDNGHNGSRLELQWFNDGGEGGTWLPIMDRFIDTELGTECAPMLWTDDKLRCVPRGRNTVFTNARCTVRIGVARAIDGQPEPASPFLIADEWVDGRRRVTGVYREAARVAYSMSVFESLPDGTCVEKHFRDPADVFFVLGEELDKDDFVTLRHDEHLSSGRLATAALTGDDGMRIAIGARDANFDHRCDLTKSQDGLTVQCLLAGATVSTMFADNACITPALEPIVTRERILAEVDHFGCPTYYKTKRVLEPQSLYTKQDGACGLGPYVTHSYRLDRTADGVGAIPVTRGAFVADEVPGRRYQHIRIGNGDASYLVADKLYDTVAQAECRPAPDNTCLPTPRGVIEVHYTDDACTASVELAVVGSCGLAATHVGPAGAVRRIGELYLEPTFVKTVDASGNTICVPYATPNFTNRFTLEPTR